MSASIFPVLGTALAALLNSLWQCAAIALLVWAALRFLPRAGLKINAATRCAVWWAVLAAVVVLLIAPQPKQTIQTQPAPAPAAAVPVAIAPAPAGREPASVAVPSAPAPSSELGPLQITAGAGLLAIVAVWAALSLFRIAQIARSYRYLRGIKLRARAVDPQQLVNFDYWLLACGIDRTARLLVSREIVSPMAVGFRRPAVIVPETLLNEFTADELDHVILHELAHIARYDDWTNLFARLIGALLPIHPVAVWLLKRIEQEREIACDDWVVAMTGEARPYAASLTRLFELCAARRRQLLATGMADRASHLGERIEALLRSGRDFAPRVSLTRVALGAAILLGLIVAGSRAPHWVAFAQEPTVGPVAPLPPVPPVVAQAPAPVRAPLPQAPPAPVAAPEPPLAPEPVEPPRPAEPASALMQVFAARQAELNAELAHLRETQRQFAEQNRRYTPDHPQMQALAQEIRAQEAQLSAQRAQMETVQAQLRAQEAQTRAERANNAPNNSFLAALVAAGYGDLSVDEIIELRSNGVSPDFLRGIAQSGWGKLPTRDLLNLARNGVSPAYLAAMKNAGFKNLTPENVVEMRQHGVRPDTFQEIHALGFGPYSPKEASDFTAHGVRPELFRALKDVGLTKVEPAEIIEAANNGLRGDNLRAAREFGPNLTLKQIIRLKQAGVI